MAFINPTLILPKIFDVFTSQKKFIESTPIRFKTKTKKQWFNKNAIKLHSN